MTGQPTARARIITAEQGFTFLELVVVVTLLAILTSMVVPMFSASMRAIQHRSSRNDFVSLVAFLQARSVAESREYRLYLRETKGEYWAARLEAMDGEDKVFKPVDDPYGQLQTLPPRVKFDVSKAPRDSREKANYIGFYPNGGCDRAVIVLSDINDREKSFRLATSGALGRIEIKEFK